MGCQSAYSSAFQDKVADWIARRHEVLAVIRYAAAGGAKSFEFFDSFEVFRARLNESPPKTCIVVFGERQLPLRGRVDNHFIEQALSLVPDGAEFVVAGLELMHVGKAAWFPDYAGETHVELREALEGMLGELAAVGPYPPFWEDGEEVVFAVIPNPDGSVTCGPY
jgi:hypothetical protein